MVFEQGRETRVKYGKGVRKMLSERLTEKFGYTDIFQFCSFYIAFSKLQTVSEISKGSEVWVKEDLDFAHTETRNRMFFYFLGLTTLYLCASTTLKHVAFMRLKITTCSGAYANSSDKLAAACMNVWN